MSFPESLKFFMERAKLSQRVFAEKAGISGGYPAHFLTGKRPPPLDRLTQMADALGLTGQDRQAFTQAAHLAHAPGEVRALVNSLRLDLAKSRQETTDLRSQVAGFTAQLNTAKGDLDALRRDFRALLSVVRERGIKLPKGVGDV